MTGCRKKCASGPTAPLAQREALRHSVADLATALEAARLLVYHAASLYAEGAECVSEVSMTERMITNTSAAAPRSVGRSRAVAWRCRFEGFAQSSLSHTSWSFWFE